MKLGDKVSFLFSQGGGKVAAIKGNIVMVEDEDGFQIPTPINEVVVVSSKESYSTTNMVKAMEERERKQASRHSEGKSTKALLNEYDDDDAAEIEDDDPSQGEISFKMPVIERKGGNQLSVYLAYVPEDIKQVSNTRFDTYIVNDSNYSIMYTYMSGENNLWHLRAHGVIEPNTKEFIEDFTHQEVNELSRVAFQIVAFKEEKPYVLKPAIDVRLRIDQVKFFKLHTFQPNDFFEEPALLYPIVENDKVQNTVNVSTDELKERMYAKPDEEENQYALKAKLTRHGLEDALVVDLHADKLLDSTANMSSSDILNFQLEKFREVMKTHRHEKGKKIVFIHGKGEGVLRHAIIHELNYRYRSCTYQDASFQEYGYGATQVTIK